MAGKEHGRDIGTRLQVSGHRQPRQSGFAHSPRARVMCYREIWAIDFEFRAPAGHRPEVVCLCARELLSGRVIQLWVDEFGACPFDTGDDVLFVAFFASAEVSCFKVARMADAASAARPVRRAQGDHQRSPSNRRQLATRGYGDIRVGCNGSRRKEAPSRPDHRWTTIHRRGAGRNFGLLHGGRRRDGSAACGNGTNNRCHTSPLRPGAAQRPLHGRCSRYGACWNAARRYHARRH